jgi:uncharacterized protein (DUF924 family)
LNSESGADPAQVVAFWREAGPDKWFKKNADFDRSIIERFGALHGDAVAGRLQDWAATPEGALALVLILDQFSRNMFRGIPKAFSGDEMALAIAVKAIDAGFDKELSPELSGFFHMPFMHSEAIADQMRCVSLVHAFTPQNLRYAREHERIIRRFGRFPHRNPILGRHSTPAEQAFMAGGGFAG